MAFLLAGIAAIESLNQSAVRRAKSKIRKVWHISLTTFGFEFGFRGLVWLLVLAAASGACSVWTFDVKPVVGNAIDCWWSDKWKTLKLDPIWKNWLISAVTVAVTLVLNNLCGAKAVFGSQAGRVWRHDRKSRTAAVLSTIRNDVGKRRFTDQEAIALLESILDIIVSHVRDHRGRVRNRRGDVFANILVPDSDDVVVIARDRVLHSKDSIRTKPARYKKSETLCGDAISYMQPVSIGSLKEEYPDKDFGKPYESILALPIFGEGPRTSEGIVAVLSIDCSTPYFFDSFREGQVEDDFQNSLAPYCSLIALVFKQYVSKNGEIRASLVQRTGKQEQA